MKLNWNHYISDHPGDKPLCLQPARASAISRLQAVSQARLSRFKLVSITMLAALLLDLFALQAQDTAVPTQTNDVSQADDATGTDTSQTMDTAEDATGTNTVAETNQTVVGPDGRTRRLRRRAQNRSRDYAQSGNSARPGSTGGNPGSPLDYSAFQMVAEKNIFNPNRSPRSGPVATQPKTVDAFTLVGTMSYEKGIFAFFDGTSSDYKKALKPNETIAGYKLVAISADSAKLMLDTNVLDLAVGTQMRRRDDGTWERSANAESYTTSGASSSSSATDTSSNGAENDIIKKMMLRREKE